MRAGDSPSALSGSASAVEVLDLTVEAADGIHVLVSGFSLPVGNGSRARLGFARRQNVGSV